MANLGRFALSLMVAFGVLATSQAPASSQVREYEVKAAFLLRFAQFTEWPRDAFGSGAAPFSIAILGHDPFGPTIEKVMAGQTIKNRSVAVMRVKWGTDLSSFNLVFVSDREAGRAKELAKYTKGRPVVVVGESSGFAKAGGLINFYVESARIRFEINNRAARALGIQFSSQLLSLARIVE